MKTNKLIPIALVLMMLVSLLPGQAFAGGTTSNELKKQIEKNYGFTIEVPKAEFSEASEEDRMFFYKELDMALNSLNKDFVKEVTDYYASKGIKSRIVIKILSWGFMEPSTFGVANNTATITLDFMHPQSRNHIDKSILAHEFGHMVNVALDYKEGSTKIKNSWLAIDNKESDSSKSYITPYAGISYREDIAETFSHMAAKGIQDNLFSIMLETPESVIIEKMDYLDSLIKKHFNKYKGMQIYGLYKPQKPSHWSKEAIDNLLEEGKITGTYTSKYQGNITRGEFCELLINTILQRHLTSEAPQDYRDIVFQSNYFKDISVYNNDLTRDQCYSINKAHALGLVNGKSEGYFDHLGLITRQEVAIVLKNTVEFLNKQEYTKQELPFADKNNIASWAIEAVEYVYANNIMKGTAEDKFDPLGLFTYEQAYITLDTIDKLRK